MTADVLPRVTTWSSPVRYAECDQQGIVFNAHYLLWCDEAFSVWLGGADGAESAFAGRGLDAKVVAADLQWRSSARWGDVVDVSAVVDRIGGSSFTMAFDIRVGQRHCCSVRTTYVMVSETDDRPVRVPDDLRIAWSGHL
jgi:acyl-CoA thioester hydrolase